MAHDSTASVEQNLELARGIVASFADGDAGAADRLLEFRHGKLLRWDGWHLRSVARTAAGLAD